MNNQIKEINYIKKQLKEIGFSPSPEIINWILNLHFLFLSKKGEAPRDPEFEDHLQKMKENTRKRKKQWWAM